MIDFHSDVPQEQAAALEVCAGCPVVLACRSWALETIERHGIWGGTTPEQRLAYWRARSARRHGRTAAPQHRAAGLDAGPAGRPATTPVTSGSVLDVEVAS